MNSKHICRFCKRGFPCGRSLGGHIRSHLIHKNSSSSSVAPNEEPGSPSKPRYQLRENPKKTYKDCNLVSSSSVWSDESETEDGSDPNRRNRLQNPNGKSCFHGGNNSGSSVSEVVEPKQEEIATAMCLIMLSRDVGNWGDVSSSVKAKFLEKIALLQVDQSERIRRDKIQGKNPVSGSVSNYSNRNNQNLKYAASGHLQNGSKMKEIQALPNGFTSNDQTSEPHQSKRKSDDLDHKKKMETLASGHVGNWSKIRESGVSQDGCALNDHKCNDRESGFEEIEMGTEVCKNSTKRSKFECNTCNKVFHSYQALGGHRASHKKMVGMKLSPVSKLESNDISTVEGSLSPNGDQQQQDQELGTEIGIGTSSQSPNKVVQKHECPICFRVFSSGQALGGHKRSHLLAANNSSCEINLVEKSSSPEIRDFLDLNLPPAPAEEGSSSSLVGLIKPYWWVESSHNHEPFLSLISN